MLASLAFSPLLSRCPRSRYTSTDASAAIVSYLVPPEMCAAWSTTRAGLVFGSSCCQLEIEAASDGAVVDLVTYRCASPCLAKPFSMHSHGFELAPSMRRCCVFAPMHCSTALQRVPFRAAPTARGSTFAAAWLTSSAVTCSS